MTTRTANDPLRQAEKIRARLLAQCERGSQIVFLDFKGCPDCCVVGSARHLGLERNPNFARHVAGVFDHRASTALLADALREIRHA